MNYLANLYRIILSVSFNCTLFNALVEIDSDGKSVLTQINGTAFKGLGEINSEISADIIQKVATNLQNIRILSDTNAKAKAKILGRVFANVRITATGEIDCEITECSSILIDKVGILAGLSLIAQTLVKTALKINANVLEDTDILAKLKSPMPTELNPLVEIKFSGLGKLKLFSEFTEMLAEIGAVSEILPYVSVLEAVNLGSGSISEVIDLDILANIRLPNAQYGQLELFSTTTLTSELKMLIEAYVSDYYSKTIANAFYGGTLEEAWRTIV